MDTSAYTKPYDSNPFTTVIAGIKKLWDLNANALVGLIFFSVAVGLLFMASSVAVAIATLAFIQQHHLADGLTQAWLQYSPLNDALGSMNSVGIYVTWTIGFIMIIVLSALLQIVAIKLALASSTEQSVGFGWVLQQSVSRIIPAIGLALLMVVAITLPATVLILVGEFIGPIVITFVILGFIALLYACVRFSYVWLSLVDGRNPIAALKESWAVSAGHFFETLGVIAASITMVMLPIVIMNIFGTLIGGVIGGLIGLVILFTQLLSIAFVAVGIAERFRQLRLVKAGKITATKTDSLNYVALAALFVLLLISVSFKQQSSDIPPPPTPIYSQYQ